MDGNIIGFHFVKEGILGFFGLNFENL